MASRARQATVASGGSGGSGVVILAAIIIGLLDIAWKSVVFWLGWNALNIHDVYGVATDASFEQIVIAAIVASSIAPSLKASS